MKLPAIVLVAVCAAGLTAAPPSNDSAGSADERLGPLRDLDGHFPFVPSASKADWEVRAAALRRQVRVALGLWPWPTRTPLNAVVHGAVTRDGYTVERAYFESVPGHFVTGSLYRPAGRTGRLPAVLSPHGHWPGGRFQDVAEGERRKQLASGAERFDNGARHLLQARAVQLARMGTVVFLFDMIGYADSVQIPQAIAHSPRGRQRAESAGLFFSVDAELNLHSILGLQIWNGIRALDFLTSLPDVDPARVAVTGASGGGTQTFLISALDDRPAVAFPAVMVSTRMQGGCTCENADYLRIGTGNVELAALFAPKPLGMTAADDWTRTMPVDGFPELQKHFALYGAKDHVALFPFLQFGHNYNHVSRTAMYGWLNRHLKLGFDEPVLERDFVPLSPAEATVWDTAHPAPPVSDDHERAVTRWWREDATRQLASPRTARTLGSWRDVMGGAVAAILGRPARFASSDELSHATEQAPRIVRDVSGTLLVEPYSEQVRTALRLPAPPMMPRGLTVVTASRGIGGMTADGAPEPVVLALLSAGQAVLAVEVLGRDAGVTENRLVTNRSAAAYTYGYNTPLVVQRARDTLAALSNARQLAGGEHRVTLLALDGPSSAWAALAWAHAGALVDAAAFVTDGFRFATAASIEDASFLPGAVKYGDLPSLLALGAPRPLWVAGEPADSTKQLAEIYRVAGAPRALTVSKATGGRVTRDMVAWVAGPRD